MPKFSEIFEFQKKSRIKAGSGLTEAKHPFYTSSTTLTKYHDDFLFDGDSLIFGSGGDASIHFNAGKFSVSTDCLVAQPKDRTGLVTKYYFYYLKYNIRILKKGFKGAGLKHISKNYILQINLPEAGYEQQKEVVEILDLANSLLQKRKLSAKLLNDLLDVTFFDLFGDPIKNNKKWDGSKLASISDIQGGVQVTAKRKSNPIEVPYLRVANVYRDRLFLDEIKTIRVTEAELARTTLKTDDILIVEGHGNQDEIGRTAVWDGSIDPCIHQNHLIRIRIDVKRAHPRYVSAFLNSAGGRSQLFKMRKTTSGLNTISSSNVKALNIILPPLAVQKKYVMALTQIEKIKIKINQSSVQMENQLNAFMQKAFGDAENV